MNDKLSSGGVLSGVSVSSPSFSSVSSVPDNDRLPSLSGVLQLDYQVLDDDMRRLFIKIYKYLWGVVNARSVKRCGVTSYFWLITRVSLSSGLSPSSFLLLSYLYMVTNGGKKYIHSNTVYGSCSIPGAMPGTYQRVMWDLKHAGLLSRHHKDPDQPYLQRAQHNKQPVFIALTRAGVQLIEGIEKDLYKMLLNTSLNDLTGQNKKP